MLKTRCCFLHLIPFLVGVLFLFGFCEARGEDSTVTIPSTEEFSARSHPPRYELVSPFNPWGEDLLEHEILPANFGEWIVTAAKAYATQGIRFDGYMGSTDDGQHLRTAADGEDGAYFGDAPTSSYLVKKSGVADDLNERVWICLDLPVYAITLAGFPLREAMNDDFYDAPSVYTLGGGFPENTPDTHYFYRRVRNFITFFQRHHKYVELRVTKEQLRDQSYIPTEKCQPGDILFFGHYNGTDDSGKVWFAKHSGIVGTVDDRGIPITIYNMRVSRNLREYYDGEMNQKRMIDGKEILFKKYSDRYSLIGFARIVEAYIED